MGDLSSSSNRSYFGSKTPPDSAHIRLLPSPSRFFALPTTAPTAPATPATTKPLPTNGWVCPTPPPLLGLTSTLLWHFQGFYHVCF